MTFRLSKIPYHIVKEICLKTKAEATLRLAKTSPRLNKIIQKTRPRIVKSAKDYVVLTEKIRTFQKARDAVARLIQEDRNAGRETPSKVREELATLAKKRNDLVEETLAAYREFDLFHRKKMRAFLEKDAICCKKCLYYGHFIRTIEEIDLSVPAFPTK